MKGKPAQSSPTSGTKLINDTTPASILQAITREVSHTMNLVQEILPSQVQIESDPLNTVSDSDALFVIGVYRFYRPRETAKRHRMSLKLYLDATGWIRIEQIAYVNAN